MSCCRYVCASFVLLFSAAAVALSVVSLLYPFASIKPGRARGYLGEMNGLLEKTPSSPGGVWTTDDRTRFLTLSGYPGEGTEMTVWEARIYTPRYVAPSASSSTATGYMTKAEEPSAVFTLRGDGGRNSDFFQCKQGKLLAQALQAAVVLSLVFSVASFFLALFLFCVPSVVRVALALASFFTVLASAAALGMEASLLTLGWCPAGEQWSPSRKLRDDGWSFVLAFLFIVIVCAVSLINTILAAATPE